MRIRARTRALRMSSAQEPYESAHERVCVAPPSIGGVEGWDDSERVGAWGRDVAGRGYKTLALVWYCGGRAVALAVVLQYRGEKDAYAPRSDLMRAVG